jgi:hypothetical protein
MTVAAVVDTLHRFPGDRRDRVFGHYAPDPQRPIGRQLVVDLHVQCGSEGVRIGVHGDLPGRIVGFSNADHGRLRRVTRGSRYRRWTLESAI